MKPSNYLNINIKEILKAILYSFITAGIEIVVNRYCYDISNLFISVSSGSVLLIYLAKIIFTNSKGSILKEEVRTSSRRSPGEDEDGGGATTPLEGF